MLYQDIVLSKARLGFDDLKIKTCCKNLLLPKKSLAKKLARLFSKKMFALASASLHVILSDGSDSVVSFSSKIFSDYRDTKADRDNKKEDKTNFNGIIFPIHKLVG